MQQEVLLEIIKKQQELINLMMTAGIVSTEYPCTIPDVKQAEPEQADRSPVTMKSVDEFASYLRAEGRSENTIEAYTLAVRKYFEKWDETNPENLLSYQEFLKENFAPKTVNLKISAMSIYLKFIGYDDFRFKPIKIQQKTFCDNAIDEENYNKLIAYAESNAPRVWLIAKVIANTGVRVSELITLKTGDLDRGYTDIVGKGGKQRRIYYPDRLVKEIRNKCGKRYIIENNRGEQITTRGVSEILKRAAVAAGVPSEIVYPHSFRHFFAKQFLKSNNNISLLGDLLGHSDCGTTAIYTRMTSEEQKNKVNEVVGW